MMGIQRLVRAVKPRPQDAQCVIPDENDPTTGGQPADCCQLSSHRKLQNPSSESDGKKEPARRAAMPVGITLA